MDNTGGAIINERMRVLLLGKHTGSTRFEHSVLPGRLGGAAASSGQSRSGGGSPWTEQGGFGDGAAFSGHMGSGGGSPGSSTSSTCLGAGLAAATGQLRSGGGSPGLQGVADSTGVAGGGDESSWSRAGDWGALHTRANSLSITLTATVVALGATSQVTRQEDSTTLRVTWLQAGVVALLAGSSVRATVVATLYGARRFGGAAS